MPMAQEKAIFCSVLFASVESRLTSQQFTLEDAFLNYCIIQVHVFQPFLEKKFVG